jgi:hypothetical protein
VSAQQEAFARAAAKLVAARRANGAFYQWNTEELRQEYPRTATEAMLLSDGYARLPGMTDFVFVDEHPRWGRVWRTDPGAGIGAFLNRVEKVYYSVELDQPRHPITLEASVVAEVREWKPSEVMTEEAAEWLRDEPFGVRPERVTIGKPFEGDSESDFAEFLSEVSLQYGAPGLHADFSKVLPKLEDSRSQLFQAVSKMGKAKSPKSAGLVKPCMSCGAAHEESGAYCMGTYCAHDARRANRKQKGK